MGTKLYVGNLPFNTTENELQELFSQAGAVQEVTLMQDRFTGKSRGFAFITMGSDEDTVAAVDMAVAAKVASEEATDEFANHGSCRRDWAGLDSNQRRRKASRFTVCPVWPLRYLPLL